MGLTNTSTGLGASARELTVTRRRPGDRIIAIAGNPNVGKSTLFNHLTNLHQHTGNWPGKTVSNAQGWCQSSSHSYVLVDIPGTYSLMAHSAEEEVARSFLCFGEKNGVAVVCDAALLERNLNLVLQIMECTRPVMVCVNLLDEAKRNHISVDLNTLSRLLGVPVVGTVAHSRTAASDFLEALDRMTDAKPAGFFHVSYEAALEQAAALLEQALRLWEQESGMQDRLFRGLNLRWLALKLLENDAGLIQDISGFLGFSPAEPAIIRSALQEAWLLLDAQSITPEAIPNHLVRGLTDTAAAIAAQTVRQHASDGASSGRGPMLDRLFTGRFTAYPLMALLLAAVFWLTIAGANYPSALLSSLLFRIQDGLSAFFAAVGAPEWLHSMLVLGVYRTLAWVVSVMLPPMAVFFPLFALLEDAGFLPRIAYNLDRPFQRCRACGKQALTICMGFGCNAAGIVGCRIIDSPRERLIAILTNSFVPCNGRFPTLITLITLFFVGNAGGLGSSLLSSLLLTFFILLGIAMTFLVSWVLSRTLLTGMPSSFILELPPYRRPQVGRVIVRSFLDRTLFVLGRAAAVAAPAGLLLWLMANVSVGGSTLLVHCAALLDPLGRCLGMDGVILMAFLLGLPANEIVIPIVLMAYMTQGSLIALEDMTLLQELLTANGWTWTTAVCVILFSLMHWPCSTTLLTIYRETRSLRWTALAFLIPTLCGMAACLIVAAAARGLAFL